MEPDVDATLNALLNLAQFPNTFAKLTSLSFDDKDSYTYRSLHEPLMRTIAVYSPSRCVWGSNFPCERWTPRSTYRQNMELFSKEFGLSRETQEAMFWKTPWKLWFEKR